MADDPAILESPLPEANAFTYADALEHLRDFLGGSSADTAQTLARRCVQLAYTRLMTETDWRFLYSHGRVNLVAYYNTGTVTFDLTGGSSERLLTLDSGTWPTWAKYGHLNINSVIYEVEQRLSSTTLQLAQPLCPSDDIAAGTSYILYRNIYPLPSNFKRLCEPNTEHLRRTRYVPPQEFIWLERHRRTAGYPYVWTILPSVNRAGEFVIALYGYPTAAETLDFMYQRYMRPMVHTGFDANDYTGTITVSANSTAVTGSGTTFTSNMVGSYIRFTASTSTVPSGLGGLNPFTEQRKIRTVTDATHIVLDAAVDNAYTGCKFTVTDPCDFPPYMLTAFLRGCEHQFAIVGRLSDVGNYYQFYQAEVLRARESDSIVDIGRALGSYRFDSQGGWRSGIGDTMSQVG